MQGMIDWCTGRSTAVAGTARGTWALLAPIVVCAGSVIQSGATERHVPAQYPTIQAAVDASVNGDVVVLADGVYHGYGNRDVEYLGKAITIRSQHGSATCIIDCEGTWSQPHRGFHFRHAETAASVLEGLTIQRGYAPDEGEPCHKSGGGILCRENANPTIRQCVVRWNVTDGL